MRKITNISIFLIAVFFCISCNSDKEFSNITEFENYLKNESNILSQNIEKNGVKLSLTFLPTEALMIRQSKKYIKEKNRIKADTLLNTKMQKNKLLALRNKLTSTEDNYSKNIYFKLGMEFIDDSQDIIYASLGKGFSNYSSWVQKLLFSLEKNITLETSLIPEIPTAFYHMERNYGTSKRRNFLVAFPTEFNEMKILNSNSDQIKINIKEFGLGIGNVEFKYDIQIITKQIKIRNLEL